MRKVDLKRVVFTWALIFFVFGAIVDFLLLKWVIRQMYSGGSDGFANNVLTKLSVTLLGGVYLSLFMTRLLAKTLRRKAAGPIAVIGNSGLRGMLATVLAFETFYIFTSIYLSLFIRNELHPTLVQRLGMSVLWFISIQTYGLYPIALILGFSLLCGFSAGIGIFWVAGRQHPNCG